MTGGTDLFFVSEEAIRDEILPPGGATPEGTEYDLLRLVTWSLTRSQEPAHIVRILNCAVELARPLVPASVTSEVLRDRLRGRLEDLAEAGDLVWMDEGRWLPAPVRQVPLGARREGALLVGGVPTSSLPREMSANLLPHGAYRQLRSVAAFSDLALPSEPLEAWTQAPAEPLKAWGEGILNAPLPDYREPQRDESAFRLYLPSKARPGSTQLRRWSERVGGISGRYLAERSRVFGAREYRVVEVSNGRVVKSGNVLAPGEAARLRYALDALSGNPTRVSWHEDRDGVIVTLWSSIPRPEQRLLAALGSLETSERPYPRRWHFARADASVVRARLEALAVAIAQS